MVQTKTMQRMSQALPQNVPTTAPLTTSSLPGLPSIAQKPSTRSATKGSPAVQYEQSLNQVLHDFEMLLVTLDGKTELAPTLVYAIFEAMCSRGLEIEKGNPEIMINSIQDQKMTKLVAYKKGAVESTEAASSNAQRIDFKTSDSMAKGCIPN